MAQIQLNAVPDAQLPEVKGAVTASNNEVYVADGAGSGSFQGPVALKASVGAQNNGVRINSTGALVPVTYGYDLFVDGEYTTGSPLAITSGTNTKLNLTEANLTSRTSQGLTTTYDYTNDTFSVEGLNSLYRVGLQFKVRPATNNTSIDVSLQSPTVTPSPFTGTNLYMSKGANQEHLFIAELPLQASAAIISNNVEVYFQPNGTNVEIYEIQLLIQKIFEGVT